MTMTVLVFGSLNMDQVTWCDRLPQLGETVQGQRFSQIPGGKGANQAVALARLGCPTAMIGRVGDDALGRSLLQSLADAGVDASGVFVDAQTQSGMAAIAVDPQGNNHIIIVPGANSRVNRTDVDRLCNRLPTADALLLQLEIPLDTVISAAQSAVAAGVNVVLDPAPACELPEALLAATYIITPNQTEAEHLVGFPVENTDAAVRAGEVLLQRGVEIAVITLGAQGAIAVTADGVLFQPSFAVDVVDTVAAGDAFNAGLTSAWVEGQPFSKALRWASAVAALSASKSGAQPSLPTRQAVQKFLAQQLPTP
jgi:ribokinase